MSARIVVADDEQDIRRLICFTLRRRGYIVLEAADGDAALSLIQAEQPNLAILGVMMPGRSGLAVTQALKADPRTSAIPIILLSANGQNAEIEAGLAQGAHSYLVKPFAPQALAVHVEETLAHSEEMGGKEAHGTG